MATAAVTTTAICLRGHEYVVGKNCVECNKIRCNKAYKRHKESGHRRRYLLQKMYGISMEDYESFMEAQDGRCAICLTDDPGKHEWFSVDHDHGTGEVRGLLCNQCNMAIGLLEDNIEALNRAISYLGK